MPTPRQYQFDVDTKRYLNRVNTYRSLNGLADIQKSDAADIDNFVIGLKDLGLWYSAIFWSMRSIHNIGTGSTILSIGGLGRYDGTLVNSPTWGTNGITNSATGRIDTSWLIDGGGQAHIFVGNSTTASAVRCYGGTLSNSNTRGIRFRDDAVLWGDGTLRQWNVALSSIGNFKMAAALYNRPETMYAFLNTTQNTFTSHGEVVAGTNPLSLLNARDLGSSTQFYSGQAALYLTIMRRLTIAQYNSIYNLYKTTIGKGLSLP
jgi:hypothetical protein